MIAIPDELWRAQRLAERYRPQSLSEVVGQPAAKVLAGYVRNPYATCWRFEGPAGVGKTCAAMALAAELGCVDDWTGLRVIDSVKLNREEAEDLLRSMWLKTLGGTWKVIILEEMERLSPQASCILKRGLASEHLPPNTIVVATSNDTSNIDEALLERFSPLEFRGWTDLATAGAARIAWLWCEETGGDPLPSGAESWGWHRKDGRPVRYSLRAALDAAQQALLLREAA